MKISTMLVIMAHPDDIEISCYGLISKMKKQGTKCIAVVVTNGENVLKNNEDIIDRKEEAKNALSELTKEIIWLEQDDGKVCLDCYLIDKIRKLIEIYLPQMIVTHFPEDMGIEHQDHNAVGRATINASFRYAKELKYLLLSEPLFDNLTQFKPNCFVEMTEYFEKKIVALGRHKSQKGKIYMSKYFHNIRSTVALPCINMQNLCEDKKVEMFQIIYERI